MGGKCCRVTACPLRRVSGLRTTAAATRKRTARPRRRNPWRPPGICSPGLGGRGHARGMSRHHPRHLSRPGGFQPRTAVPDSRGAGCLDRGADARYTCPRSVDTSSRSAVSRSPRARRLVAAGRTWGWFRDPWPRLHRTWQRSQDSRGAVSARGLAHTNCEAPAGTFMSRGSQDTVAAECHDWRSVEKMDGRLNDKGDALVLRSGRATGAPRSDGCG